jgi:glucokinase
LIAAGTGLGEAVVAFDGDGPRVLPSEGGHASFAPRTPREAALLARLAGAQGAHVPVERVLSGPGLVRIYEFLLDLRGGPPSPSFAASKREGGDLAAAIAGSGLRGDDALCAEALELFSSCYGSEAGNLALRALSHGGVWIGGGIAPKLLPALRAGAFLEAFRDKGRFRGWLSSLPVAVCLAEDAALQGALAEARRIARDRST